MKKITVASYNIRHAADADFSMARLASVAMSVGADIVGVQEMDINASRSKSIDQLKELKEAMGFDHGYFLKCVDQNEGDYGTAVVSRFPLVDVKTYKLYKGERCEQRMFGIYTLDIGERTLTFANTHLDFVSREAIKTQMKEINAFLEEERQFIMTGDFNTGEMELFREIRNAEFLMNEERRLVTFPSSEATIDNIVYRGDMRLLGYGTVEESYSDHYLLYAEFEL